LEWEELFELGEQPSCLVEAGYRLNQTGEVSRFAPPGDIHRVRNAGNRAAVSIHIHGTDVTRIGSSVRRYYDLPVQIAYACRLNRVAQRDMHENQQAATAQSRRLCGYRASRRPKLGALLREHTLLERSTGTDYHDGGLT
jgi:hypothetical protein